MDRGAWQATVQSHRVGCIWSNLARNNSTVGLDLDLLLIECKFMVYIDEVMIIIFSKDLKAYGYLYD